jgi:hypothetical protein
MNMALYDKREDRVCGDCAHFRLHYIRCEDGTYMPLHFGHCTTPRLKDRAEKQRCPHWTPKPETP